MKIAIIGTGNVALALGRGWKRCGHTIVYLSRNAKQRTTELGDAADVPIKQIAADSLDGFDAAVLAVPWSAVEQTLETLGDFKQKLLIDCTNPLKPDLSGLEIGFSDSAGERVQRQVKNARVVKAFNMTGSSNMLEPIYQGQAATMLICGDDKEAKGTVLALSEELGFETMDAGGIEISRYLEALAMLWIHLAFSQGMGTDIAFQLQRRG